MHSLNVYTRRIKTKRGFDADFIVDAKTRKVSLLSFSRFCIIAQRRATFFCDRSKSSCVKKKDALSIASHLINLF